MSYSRTKTIIFLSCIFILSFAINISAVEHDVQEDWSAGNILGSWETAIDINDDASAVITRVQLNEKGNIAIKLRELMAGLKYEVEWNENDSCILLNNDKNIIKIYANLGYYDKNGKRENLNGSVFIDRDYSYCSLSFLENALGIEIVLIEELEWSNRINRVALKSSELPNSSRKPFPYTELSVDGMPLYIDYIGNLRESLPYNTVFSICESSNGSSEELIIYTPATLGNFKISCVRYNDSSKSFMESEIIMASKVIAPPLAVLLKTTVPEGIPTEAITFTDSKGITHSYVIGYNGKDGSVTVTEVSLTAFP